MLCFTHGEASTLGPWPRRPAAHPRRGTGRRRGRTRHSLHHAPGLPDGGLASIPATTLTAHVHQHVQLARPDALLVFDEGGITGHPDHCQATAAALSAADQPDLPVIAWAIPRHVTALVNTEFGTSFAGRASGRWPHRPAVPNAVRRRNGSRMHVSYKHITFT
jgi:N-acetylglucosamine malate deacetylase 2